MIKFRSLCMGINGVEIGSRLYAICLFLALGVIICTCWLNAYLIADTVTMLFSVLIFYFDLLKMTFITLCIVDSFCRIIKFSNVWLLQLS